MRYSQKIILIILTFFGINSICAQLTVRNDAYIFVDDNVVFVEDNINLQEANSMMYLRNESQFIQGTGVTGNSGLGQLSVQQRGTSNEYAYNYWCSPIGNNSLASGNENFQVDLIDDSTGLITSIDAAFTANFNGTSSPLTISSNWLYT
ncbi:MAG: secretion protein, partial [Winogradskyella sp.]|nr:secretion protein [Winogradskyella sp.]